jgi:hypothetical protein
MATIAQIKKQILQKRRLKKNPTEIFNALNRFEELDLIVTQLIKLRKSIELEISRITNLIDEKELVSLIQTLMPKKPTDKELLMLITPLIPEQAEDGKDGRNGKDGKTPIAGLDFPFPENGKDGTELEGEEIVKKINSLPIEKDKQIDAEHIKNLPKVVEDKLKGTDLFRGGLKLIWNTQLDGTVNGSNTVFTVPASLPNPKDARYLVSARGTVKDVDSGDFTVSSDNRTITFAQAPPNGSAQPRIMLYHGS